MEVNVSMLTQQQHVLPTANSTTAQEETDASSDTQKVSVTAGKDLQDVFEEINVATDTQSRPHPHPHRRIWALIF